MTRRLIFTVDLDRDVNIQLDGQSAAGSLDRGQGTAPRFSSSERGLQVLLEMLDDIGLKCTFFVEGRTCETFDCSGIKGHCIGFHGYDHEDITAETDAKAVMRRGFEAVRDNVGMPVCFRAPYMRIDDRAYGELQHLGIRHDSSVYDSPGKGPYEVSGIIEHPVAKGKDRAGKTIAAYLWPMHEGLRKPSDYVDLAGTVNEGELVLSTHSWHMAERREGRLMSEEEVRRNRDNVADVLTSIIDSGFEGTVITESSV